MHHRAAVKSALFSWLPLAAAIAILAGTFYVAMRQNYRNSANDPQIQISEDIATAISNGSAAPEAIVPPTPSQSLGSSLSTFLAIFSATGTPLGASASFDGQLPSLSQEVFSEAESSGQQRFTWRPSPGRSYAAVLTKFGGPQPGYVMVGRSLDLVESRIRELGMFVAAAAVLSLLATFLLQWFAVRSSLPAHAADSSPGRHQ